MYISKSKKKKRINHKHQNVLNIKLLFFFRQKLFYNTTSYNATHDLRVPGESDQRGNVYMSYDMIFIYSLQYIICIIDYKMERMF